MNNSPSESSGVWLEAVSCCSKQAMLDEAGGGLQASIRKMQKEGRGQWGRRVSHSCMAVGNTIGQSWPGSWGAKADLPNEAKLQQRLRPDARRFCGARRLGSLTSQFRLKYILEGGLSARRCPLALLFSSFHLVARRDGPSLLTSSSTADMWSG